MGDTMNHPLRIRRRFNRASAFDLRRKVLVKNFMRKQKIFAQEYEEEEEENCENAYPGVDQSKDCDSDDLPGDTFEVKSESEDDEDVMEVVAVGISSEMEENNALQFESPPNDEVSKKWHVRHRIKAKLTRRKHCHTKKALDTVVTDSQPSLQVETKPDPIPSAKLDFSVCSEHNKLDAETVSDKTDKPGFVRKICRKFSFRRRYSFSSPKEEAVESVRDADDGCRVKRTTVMKQGSSRKRKGSKRVGLKRILSKKNKLGELVNNAEKKKGEWFPLVLFESKNSNAKRENPQLVQNNCGLNNSIAVQTDISCFPDAPKENCYKNEQFKSNSFSLAKENTYWLRSSAYKTEHADLWCTNRYSTRYNERMKNCHRLDDGASYKVSRSKSLQDKSVPRRVDVCRRIKSVYGPSSEHNAVNMPALVSLENLGASQCSNASRVTAAHKYRRINGKC